jgi:hypothetical protein
MHELHSRPDTQRQCRLHLGNLPLHTGIDEPLRPEHSATDQLDLVASGKLD